MSYEYTGMGTDGSTTRPIASSVIPETESPQQRVVPVLREQQSEIEQAGIRALHLASFFRPEGVASAWIFMIPIMAVPAAAGAFGAGDNNRLGGAAYGVVAGTVAGLLAWPAMMLVLPRVDGDGRSNFGIGWAGLAAALTVPAYFAGKRVREEGR